MSLTNTSASEYLQLLGLADDPGLANTQVFVDGDQPPKASQIDTHLVYMNETLGIGSLARGQTQNRDADMAFGLGGNLLLEPEAKAVFLFERDDGTVEAMSLSNPYKRGRIVEHRKGSTHEFDQERLTAQPWCPHGSVNAVDYEADVEIPEGEDPHVIYYMAAHQLRDQIAEDTAKLTMGLSSAAVLVTTVFTPIVAMPKPDVGFYVFCSIGQMVVPKKAIVSEGVPVSKTGEIPIDKPSDVTMKMLVHMDKALEEMGVISVDRNKPKELPQGAVKEAFRRGAREGLHKG